jgi:hypothetical protein
MAMELGGSVWTFAYFVPRALRFEDAAADPNAFTGEARDWVLLSTLRTPMIVATVAALWLAARQLNPVAATGGTPRPPDTPPPSRGRKAGDATVAAWTVAAYLVDDRTLHLP